MRLAILLLCALVFAAEAGAAAAPAEGAQLERTLSQLGRIDLKSTGRETLTLTFTSTASEPLAKTIPAGTIAIAENGARLVTLRAATLQAGPGESTTLEIPVAALAAIPQGEPRSFHLRNVRDERLQDFLAYAAGHDDLPKATAQLVVLALLEDISFQGWLRFCPPPDQPKAADAVVQAIDALGILRQIAPQRTFALASDKELKLRALRNPVSRPKALQLYGMTIPSDSPEPAGVAPDLGQLLHTKAGDNCPVCKMRQKAERGAGDL